MAACGDVGTRLLILRGPSGSGKSTCAKAARAALGRSVASVEQDYLRRVVLREKESAGAVNISLIDTVTRHCLDNGYHVLLEGILWSGRYRDLLDDLRRDHLGVTLAFYLDVDLDETVRRHPLRAQAVDFTVEDMRRWYTGPDPLGWPAEQIFDRSATADDVTQALVIALQRAE